MTLARFDAPASNTPARRYAHPEYAKPGAIAYRVARVSRRSFHRDMTVLRQAGFELEPVAAFTYRMVCFAFDSHRA